MDLLLYFLTYATNFRDAELNEFPQVRHLHDNRAAGPACTFFRTPGHSPAELDLAQMVSIAFPLLLVFPLNYDGRRIRSPHRPVPTGYTQAAKEWIQLAANRPGSATLV